MSQQDEILLKMGELIEKHSLEILDLQKSVANLQRDVVTAFRESGFNFQKLSKSEPSRRSTISQIHEINDAPDVEDADPDMRNTLALKILAEPSQDGKL